MLRQELARKRWYRWVAEAVALVVVLWVGYVGTVVVYELVQGVGS